MSAWLRTSVDLIGLLLVSLLISAATGYTADRTSMAMMVAVTALVQAHRSRGSTPTQGDGDD